MTRTEREVAADVIVELLVRRILSPLQRLEATAAAGLTYDDIEHAYKRRRRHGFPAPSAARQSA